MNIVLDNSIVPCDIDIHSLLLLTTRCTCCKKSSGVPGFSPAFIWRRQRAKGADKGENFKSSSCNGKAATEEKEDNDLRGCATLEEGDGGWCRGDADVKFAEILIEAKGDGDFSKRGAEARILTGATPTNFSVQNQREIRLDS